MSENIKRITQIIKSFFIGVGGTLSQNIKIMAQKGLDIKYCTVEVLTRNS